MSLWHGTYVRWLEEARVRYFEHAALTYDELVVAHETELVVRDLQVVYLAPAKLGDVVDVSVRLASAESRMRVPLESEFRLAGGKVCATARVTLVPIDANTGRPKRRWPQALTDAVRRVREKEQAAVEAREV